MMPADLRDIIADAGEMVSWNPDGTDAFVRVRLHLTRRGAAVPGWVRSELMPDNADYALGLVTTEDVDAVQDGATSFVDGLGVEWRVEQSLPLTAGGGLLGWRLFCRSAQGMSGR